MNDPRARFQLLVGLAWADGRLAPAERKKLEATADELGLPAALAAELIEQGRGEQAPLPPPDPEEAVRVRLFLELVRLALSDGELAPAERRYLQRVGSHLGIPEERIRAVLDV